MSITKITYERVNSVKHHPSADRLDVIQVIGYTVVTGRDQFKVGEAAVYFPPDMLIPNHIAQDIGVDKYLKHAVFPGDVEKSQCRVSSCRLRGVPSYGFVQGPSNYLASWGDDMTNIYSGVKYVPPARVLGGDCLPPIEDFHEYTDIENIQRFPGVFVEGEMVRVTEKIHGTNCRLGLIDNEYVAGSHRTRRAEGDPRTMYWQPMGVVEKMLKDLAGIYGKSVIVFGEIFGPKIQDMDYGMATPSFRAFDVSIGGVYLSDTVFRLACEDHNVPMVPTLAYGEFSQALVDNFTSGGTCVNVKNQIRSMFKGREGVVIKPLFEQHSDDLGGRKILKSVSVDYHQRKGAKDDG
jgi:RNA ligase (TIGR02306 family)